MVCRRAVLAAAPAALSAGCLQLLCPYGTRVTAGPFDPTSDVVDPAGKRRDLVDRAVADGTASTTLAGVAPLPDGTVVRRSGAYYHLELTGERRASVPALVADVTWEAGRSPPAGATVLAYGDLPEADRAALEFAVYGHAYDETGHPVGELRVRDEALPYPDGLESSRLADRDRVWVTWDDRAYRITVDGPGERRRYTYEYAATAVAESEDAFREWAAGEWVIALDDLGDAERAILEQAVADVYRDCRDPSGPLKALQKRITGETGQDATGEWYVGFDGERYTLSITAFATG